VDPFSASEEAEECVIDRQPERKITIESNTRSIKKKKQRVVRGIKNKNKKNLGKLKLLMD
jgi:hypothetical protein